MQQKRHKITKLLAICLTCSAGLSTGCNAQAFVLDFLLPNLLNDSSSLLSPSAIIQSIASALQDSATQTSSTPAAPTTTGSPSGTLGTTSNQTGG